MYDARLKTAWKLYKNKKGYTGTEGFKAIKKEVIADLAGDYLFTDPDFINNLSTKNRNIFQKIYDEIKYLCKIATAGSKEARELERVKKAFEDAYRADSKGVSETKYSISEIVDENNKSYGVGVRLDSELLDTLSPDERVEMVKEYVKELGGNEFTAYDGNGNPVNIKIAEKGAKFKNQKGKKVSVNKDLTNKYIGNEVKQEAITLINELVETSKFVGTEPARYSHDWLDNNGQNEWEYWTTHIVDKNNTIWKVTLNVTNSANGEKILYDINQIEKVGQSIDLDTSPLDPIIAEDGKNVNGESLNFSISADSEGKTLTEGQRNYFKNSKVVDENGNLKVMYHGTSNGGFTVFDTYGSNYGLFGQGSYFTDSKTIAESYTNKGKGNNKQVYKSYLNITNPLDMDSEANPTEWQNAFSDVDFPESGTNEQFYRAVEDFYADQMMPKWEVAEEVQGSIRDGMGYDGITHIGGGRVNADGERHRVYIAFDAEQIKNVDNQNPTADADIRYLEFLKKHKRISEYDSENLMYALIQDTLKECDVPSLDVICHMPLNMLIREPKLLNDEECRYAMNSATHLDFLIYNRISKQSVLAVEVDGYYYHKDGTAQAAGDKMKNHILDLYEIPHLRFATNGNGEKEKLVEKLTELLKS